MTEALASSPLVRAVALALVEFVWQGAAVGLAVALVLFGLRRASAQMRYVVACLGLAAMTIAPVPLRLPILKLAQVQPAPASSGPGFHRRPRRARR